MGIGQLTLEVIPLGLAAALTPMLAALQILTVAQDPWRMRSIAVAAGGALAFLGVGLLVLAGFSQLPIDDLGNSPLGYVLRIIIGAALLIASVWLLRPHPELRRSMEARVRHYVTDARTWVFFVVALVLSIKDVSSFAVLIPALHDIATSPANTAARAMVFALLYVLALLPVLGPIALRLVFGQRVVPTLTKAYRFTVDHQFTIVGVMCVVIGVWFLISGIAGVW